MKKHAPNRIPLIAIGVAPAATVTSALLSPLALGATGDLDPAFGDLGRLGPILNGPAWSLQSLDDDSILLGGGGLEYYYYWWYDGWYDASGFVSHVSGSGVVDPDFAATILANTQVFDVVRQADGQVIAVGRTIGSTLADMRLVAFRLQADGQLDDTFADNGIFELPGGDPAATNMATSVLLDPDERIVIAGSTNNQVIVLRLLPDGSMDDSFADAGIYTGSETQDYSADFSGARTIILRTADGGYRVTASNPAGCQVVALTADGAIDDTFGVSGVATVEAPSGPSTYCNAMVAQADERLLVAGSAAGQGFAARVTAAGQNDAGFSAGAVSDALADATSVAAAEDGSVVVAGIGVSGAAIMRLQASGDLDTLFGNAGSTLIDLRSATGTASVVHDMVVRADGSVLAAGGENLANQAFLVKLLGTAGGDSPGVLGVSEQSIIHTAEGEAEIVVNVRRTGGASGNVNLGYGISSGGWQSATAGEDFESVSGRLNWPDGDTAEQQIHVPILSDATTEGPETFYVTLGDVQGGAGLGTMNATIEIAADGGPSGQLYLSDSLYSTVETSSVEIAVIRDYYSSGDVSVTITPIAGTATAGDDFDATPRTVSWADGESGWKFINIPLVNDTLEELTEAFTVELSDPTGGAVLGSLTTATVRILANDQPPPQRPSTKGGAMDYLSMLLLGLLGWLRRSRRAIRARMTVPSR